MPLPNPVNTELAAASFGLSPPKEAAGEKFIVLNADGLFCDSFGWGVVAGTEPLLSPKVPNGEVENEVVPNGDGLV